MAVFACARCGAALTVPVSEVALPVHARHTFGHDMLPPLMEPGTYAVDPEPSVRRFGAPRVIALAPGDTRGMTFIPGRCDGYCLGLDGRDGPNLACVSCGEPVATRVDDCSCWQAVWLAPGAVRRLPVAGPADRVVGWAELARERRCVPPVEQLGYWSHEWTGAAGAALAHLLAACAGHPVTFADGPLADLFGRALEALLPQAGRRLPPRTLALAGPGLPDPDPAPDIVLVPVHPQTGEPWRSPPGTATSAVPLAAGVWMHLAFRPEPVPPIPVTGGLPEGVLRDDPLPLRPWGLFRPDRHVFLHTLARLPAVREPWLRAVLDG